MGVYRGILPQLTILYYNKRLHKYLKLIITNRPEIL